MRDPFYKRDRQICSRCSVYITPLSKSQNTQIIITTLLVHLDYEKNAENEQPGVLPNGICTKRPPLTKMTQKSPCPFFFSALKLKYCALLHICGSRFQQLLEGSNLNEFQSSKRNYNNDETVRSLLTQTLKASSQNREGCSFRFESRIDFTFQNRLCYKRWASWKQLPHGLEHKNLLKSIISGMSQDNCVH